MREHGKTVAKIKDSVEVSDAPLIKKLRGIVEPPGKRPSWLRNLDDQQLLEVYHRLKLNQSAYHIAKIAQRDWAILPDSKLKSVRRAISDFRNKTMGLLKAHAMSWPQSDEKTKFVEEQKKEAEKILNTVDGMEELAWLVKTQKGRLQIMVEREVLGLPSKHTDQAVGTLRECINTLLEHAEALGLIDTKPKELNLHLKTQFDGLLEGIVRDDGSRVINAAARFLELASKRALPMTKAANGKYEVEEETEGAG